MMLKRFLPLLFTLSFFSIRGQNITIKAGAHWIPHKFQGDPVIFSDARTPGYSFEAFAALPLKINCFMVEVGIARKTYSLGYAANSHYAKGFTLATNVLSFPSRLIYNYWPHKSGWNFDVLLGGSFNAQLAPYRGEGRTVGPAVLNFWNKERSVNPVFPLLELGLRGNYSTPYGLSFRLGWSKHFGFITVLENIVTFSNEDGTRTGMAIYESKGSYREVSFGISYLLLRIGHPTPQKQKLP